VIREFASAEQRARTMIARLELVSHGTVAKLDSEGGGSSDGPLLPPGGVFAKEDLEVDHPHKSHVFYRRALRRCSTEAEFAALAAAVEKTLRLWRHSARPPKDSEAWRREVGRDTRPAKVVAAEWEISASYVYQLREQFKREAA